MRGGADSGACCQSPIERRTTPVKQPGDVGAADSTSFEKNPLTFVEQPIKINS
jgi:hypothetical protein